MTQLWYNGIINTMSTDRETVEAIGVCDGHIIFLGDSNDATKMDWDEKINLNGSFVFPGFNDSHLHMLHYASFKQNIPLYDVTSIDEMIGKCQTALADNNPSSLVAVGWNQDHMVDGRIPSIKDMDCISLKVPVCAVRACLHIAVCNTAMIKRILDLPDLTPEERLDVDPETGIIKENAARVYMRAIPVLSDGEIEHLILDAQADMNACGIVAIQSDDLKSLPGIEPGRLLKIFRNMDSCGKLTLKIYEQSLLFGSDFVEIYKQCNECVTNGHFRLGPRKILLDGSLGAKTAEMIDGYIDEDPSYRGHTNYTDDELYEMVKEANARHVDVAIHTIGDLALKKAVDTIARVLDENPWPNHRHGVVHAQVTRPELLEKMYRYHIHAMIQPIFIDYDMDIIAQRIGEAHSKDAYIWRTMKSKGIHISGGSDCPVEPFDILDNMRAAITRENRKGSKVFLLDEALTAEETICLFTKDAAWTAREENMRGILENGYCADFVVLDKNLLKIPGKDYCKVNVLATVVDGKVVYRKE